MTAFLVKYKDQYVAFPRQSRQKPPEDDTGLCRDCGGSGYWFVSKTFDDVRVACVPCGGTGVADKVR